ncbi:hypothetical protein MVEN_00333600 [Mycena venus]|uniref:Uncharacterized protein n=1 Tax=Mycena venus TaxID=2733690 RepID=A0A8H6YTL8_9AGAR|nr:hypothetical protein MVEN_00333600 [Mycena venus]
MIRGTATLDGLRQHVDVLVRLTRLSSLYASFSVSFYVLDTLKAARHAQEHLIVFLTAIPLARAWFFSPKARIHGYIAEPALLASFHQGSALSSLTPRGIFHALSYDVFSFYISLLPLFCPASAVAFGFCVQL